MGLQALLCGFGFKYNYYELAGSDLRAKAEHRKRDKLVSAFVLFLNL